MNPTLKRILTPLASLRMTVALLVMAMILVFAGTTIQNEMGIWDVQKLYFHSWIAILQWRLFFPLWQWGNHNIPGALPFPGGYSLIVLLLINLLAAHALRFKLSWKRSGILLIHSGLILLILGEVITSATANEGRMIIHVGETANFTMDIREPELAVIDASPADHDQEVIVPVGRLLQKGNVEHASLPFTMQIDEFFPNSDIAGPMQKTTQGKALATIGAGVGLKLLPRDKANGIESAADQPSAFVTLTGRGGEKLGTYLVSTISLDRQFPQIDERQSVKVDGREYWIQLRYRRTYRPYTVTLLKFSHDRYQGTEVAKNFSSLVRLVDPANNVNREVLIWMNHPLRFAGETFYQAGFDPEADQFTILQVVHNSGWLIPYISCSMVGLGLLIHFGMHLLKFLSGLRTNAEPVPAKANGHGKRGAGKSQQPSSRGRAILVPIIATGICLLYLVTSVIPPETTATFDLDLFSRMPVSFDGRTMPLDSLARNSLRILSGRSDLQVGDQNRPAISWLMDVFAEPNRAAGYDIFRIDHPEVLSLLKLPENRKLFSFDEVTSHLKELQDQYVLANKVPEKHRDLYQRKIIELGQHILYFDRLASKNDLFLSPPIEATEWRQLGAVMGQLEPSQVTDPGAAAFLAIIGSKAQNLPTEFRNAASAYRNVLEQKFPEMTAKLDVEVVFNRAQPFITAMALYVIVFVLAAVSWLKWHGPLSRAALWVLGLTLAYHTLGLVTRIYLQGRPPVTNLYSSAIFIAWAAVVFCVALELIYRNGVACAAAGAIAFPSLLIAHYLAGDGDTMRMLQAVLDTNIWLATHVVVITLGYTATFLAGFLGIGYVFVGLFGGSVAPENGRKLYRMVYGVVCFAMLFSFVGTILGGIWADQSWGRFWGWDPKENGAVLIVLWNAIVLHARWGGMVREKGFMLLAIGGNIVTAWSWFGTNMLGIGLHSYGFMDSALFWLVVFALLQVGMILLGFVPTPRPKTPAKFPGLEARLS